MNARALSGYVDDLLAGRRPTPFRPDDFEAMQIRTAIDLQAARAGGDTLRDEFLDDLHGRLTAQIEGNQSINSSASRLSATRRQVVVGTSAAAAGVAVGLTTDRLLSIAGRTSSPADSVAGDMVPSQGSWRPVTSGADVADTVMHPFELGPLVGFVRRVNGRPEAVSGICTHQGCRLWFDQADDRLRCPCHSTSFSSTGQVLSHQLRSTPAPLPPLEVRERDGAIEVFAPVEPPQSS
jgi:cytochrome b6-f complex iron-sulfur subunit